MGSRDGQWDRQTDRQTDRQGAREREREWGHRTLEYIDFFSSRHRLSTVRWVALLLSSHIRKRWLWHSYKLFSTKRNGYFSFFVFLKKECFCTLRKRTFCKKKNPFLMKHASAFSLPTSLVWCCVKLSTKMTAPVPLALAFVFTQSMNHEDIFGNASQISHLYASQ